MYAIKTTKGFFATCNGHEFVLHSSAENATKYASIRQAKEQSARFKRWVTPAEFLAWEIVDFFKKT